MGVAPREQRSRCFRADPLQIASFPGYAIKRVTGTAQLVSVCCLDMFTVHNIPLPPMHSPDMRQIFGAHWTISNQMASGLVHIDQTKGFLMGASLSDIWVSDMERRAFTKEAHHTTHIEGTQLTFLDAEVLLADGQVENASPDDVQELLNYKTAFAVVSDFLKTEDPIAEGLIREIHKALVRDVRRNAAGPGAYRTVQNYVGQPNKPPIYTPPPPYEVPILMAEFVCWLNEDHSIHPVLISGIAQFQLLHIHPFLDGNGRTSRLLSLLFLNRLGYAFNGLLTISEYYDQHRSAFYEAIQKVRDTGMNLTVWLEYFVEGMRVQLANLQHDAEQSHNLSTSTRGHLRQTCDKNRDIIRTFCQFLFCTRRVVAP